MAPRNHVVITGTGRSGTTFLVQLLTRLGLDTGFTADELAAQTCARARAGLEHDPRLHDCPYIVKSPWFCDHAEEVLGRDDVVVEHVFVPVRDLRAAAESRRFVTKSETSRLPLRERLVQLVRPREFRGGLWHTRSLGRGKQEHVLLGQIYKLVLALADSSVPLTLMRYPRILKDPAYLFDKLRPVLGERSFDTFRAAFADTARPELVHSFSENDV